MGSPAGILVWINPYDTGFFSSGMLDILQKMKKFGKEKNARPRFTVALRIHECINEYFHLLLSLVFLSFILLSEQTRRTFTEEEKCPAGGESGGL